ncbi:hypothetical protein [Kineosporia sp. NBRC 101731]|uniref:hypothetical protein n=1 Tax=Kineosporia sp. NBRC 101731 TaxID=3032199 RepID=UPI00255425B8|nr:hypothetical protein [Kineosporia sp. NBRC 101731]
MPHRNESESQPQVGPVGPGPVVFAPEAHRPRDLRLLVDSSGLTLEMGLGMRQNFVWSDCEAVMVWPDRAELVLGEGASLLVRAADWHHGDRALRSITERVPTDVLVPMMADDEPQPEVYRLPGLAASPGVVLIVLALAAGAIGLMGLVIGATEKHVSALAVGTVFLVGAVPPSHAFVQRMRVPRRWRERAAVSGPVSVRVNSVMARATPGLLWTALVALLVLCAVLVGLAMDDLSTLLFALFSGAGAAGCARELLRRRRRGRRGRP